MAEALHDTARLDSWDGEAHDLWLIVAVIQPFKLDAVTLALEALPEFGGVTVSDCRGFGRGKLARERSESQSVAPSPISSSAPVAVNLVSDAGGIIDYVRKVRLDVAVAGRARGIEIARAIAKAAHTGRNGDGKVFVIRLAGAIGIRAFDVDHDAL